MPRYSCSTCDYHGPHGWCSVMGEKIAGVLIDNSCKIHSANRRPKEDQPTLDGAGDMAEAKWYEEQSRTRWE